MPGRQAVVERARDGEDVALDAALDAHAPERLGRHRVHLPVGVRVELGGRVVAQAAEVDDAVDAVERRGGDVADVGDVTDSRRSRKLAEGLVAEVQAVEQPDAVAALDELRDEDAADVAGAAGDEHRWPGFGAASARPLERFTAAHGTESGGRCASSHGPAVARMLSAPLGAERGDVGERLAGQLGPDLRRAKALGLAPARAADRVERVGRAGDLRDDLPQLPRLGDLDVVDAGLEAPARAQRLGDHEHARGEEDADAVLVVGVGLVVEVDADVGARPGRARGRRR